MSIPVVAGAYPASVRRRRAHECRRERRRARGADRAGGARRRRARRRRFATRSVIGFGVRPEPRCDRRSRQRVRARARQCGGATPRGRSDGPEVPVLSAAPAAALLAALAVAALLATHTLSVGRDLRGAARRSLRAPARRRWPYLVGTLTTGLTVFLLTPFVEVIGSHAIWTGPTIPVVGTLDVTTRGAPQRSLPGSAADGGRARVRRLRAAPRPRPVARLGRVGAALDARRRARDAARAGARARRARPAARPARPQRRARAGARSSRRSSQARSNAGSTSPRRWRLAATGVPAERGRRARRGGTVDRRRARRRGRDRRRGSAVALARVEDSRFAYAGGRAGAARRLADGRPRASTSRCSARRARASRACCARSPGSCRTFTAARSRAVSSSPVSTRARPARRCSPARSRRSSRIPRTRS